MSCESEMHEPQSGLAEHEEAEVWASCAALELTEEAESNMSTSILAAFRPCDWQRSVR